MIETLPAVSFSATIGRCDAVQNSCSYYSFKYEINKFNGKNIIIGAGNLYVAWEHNKYSGIQKTKKIRLFSTFYNI